MRDKWGCLLCFSKEKSVFSVQTAKEGFGLVADGVKWVLQILVGEELMHL